MEKIINEFTILIVGRNTKTFIEKCILSAVTQKFDTERFSVIFGDDFSDDGTFEIAKLFEQKYPNFKAYQNPKRLYKNFNILDKLKNYAKPKSIVLILDADDWLAHEGVLTYLDQIYNDDVWMTYGLYEEFPYKNVRMYYDKYSDDVVRRNAFREASWYATHLGTYRRELYLKIKEEDFLDESGEPLKMTGDLAMMFPILEMCGERFRFIDQVLYIYNRTNPLADDYLNAKMQLDLDAYLRKKPRYQRLKDLNELYS